MGIGVVVAVAVVIAALVLVVPRNFPEQFSFPLDTHNTWEQDWCVTQPTTVTFDWNSSARAPIDFEVRLFAPGNTSDLYPPTYDVTGLLGAGTFSTNGANGEGVNFAVPGNPGVGLWVNVSISYTLSGHVLGSAPAVDCNNLFGPIFENPPG